VSHGLLLRLAGAALAAAVLCPAGCGRPADPAPEPPAPPPPADGPWVRPSPDPGAEPVWGVRGGLAVGLWPTGGPRGLIRVYAPYLGQPHGRVVNFIAVEPVVNGVRGQSELEVGRVSGGPGLAMWTADTRDGLAGGPGGRPAAGRVEHIDGAEALTIWLATEPFRNGARPVLQIVLRADRPHEVAFRVHAAPGGTPPDSCVLTATMGNYARLRRLWLRGEVVDARLVWPTFVPDPLGFAPWRAWGRDRLLTVGGDLVVAATPDEADPAGATYDPAVPTHWRYVGRPATQYWRTADVPGAVARVNGRTTYWGRGGPIPGGVAYENFELEVPFADGQELRFGVTPAGPAGLGFDPAWVRNRTGG
jgi:hypothetical protein